MKTKRVRDGKFSYLVDEKGDKLAKSFTQWVFEKGLKKEDASVRRDNILRFMKKEKKQNFFYLLGEKELYLTIKGEQFIDTCKNTLKDTPMYTDPKIVRQSVEKLATNKDNVVDLNHLRDIYLDQLARMALSTSHPFSINRCFANPYGRDKRVFIDLYRVVNDVHEGYVILGARGTLNAIQTMVVEQGKYAVMRKNYGDAAKVFILASSFDDEGYRYAELNLTNVVCMTIAELAERLVSDAARYFEEGDASYKMKDWGSLYSSVLGAGDTMLKSCEKILKVG